MFKMSTITKLTLAFSDIFPKPLGIFSPNFTRLLHVPIYANLHSIISNCDEVRRIKRDHTACVSADGGHFEVHMMVVALGITSSELQVI